jgi:hypothetical protein
VIADGLLAEIEDFRGVGYCFDILRKNGAAEKD